MEGQFAITEESIRSTNDHFSPVRALQFHIKQNHPEVKQWFWYAYKKERGIHYFLWQDYHTKKKSDEYLEALCTDGWHVYELDNSCKRRT